MKTPTKQSNANDLENKADKVNTAQENINDNTSDTQLKEEENKEQQQKPPNLEEELEDMRSKYLRLFAEFENYKKRVLKERIELMDVSNKEMILSILPVLDDIERAEKQIEEKKIDLASYVDGVKLIFHKFKTILESKGLKSIDSVGQKFNTELHEAVTEIPIPKDIDKGKVVDEIEKGYKLNEKIIRFAKVVVGK